MRVITNTNLQVDIDSSILLTSTEHVATILVIQFPPKLSLNTDVIREFLYGICPLFSDKDMITCSR